MAAKTSRAIAATGGSRSTASTCARAPHLGRVGVRARARARARVGVRVEVRVRDRLTLTLTLTLTISLTRCAPVRWRPVSSRPR